MLTEGEYFLKYLNGNKPTYRCWRSCVVFEAGFEDVCPPPSGRTWCGIPAGSPYGRPCYSSHTYTCSGCVPAQWRRPWAVGRSQGPGCSSLSEQKGRQNSETYKLKVFSGFLFLIIFNFSEILIVHILIYC